MYSSVMLTLFLLALRCVLSFCQDQCLRTIYINNQRINSNQADGSLDSPFQNLDDGFAVFEKNFGQPCHIQFMLAPSAQPYTLTNSLYDDRHQNVWNNLTIELWQGQNLNNNEVTLLLNGTTLSFIHLKSLHIRNVKIIGNSSVIDLFGTDLFVENVQVNVTKCLRGFFINVEEAKVIEIEGLIYSPNQKGNFLSYYSKRWEIKPDILLRDIVILAAEYESATALVANLTLNYSRNRGKVVVDKVQMNYDNEFLHKWFVKQIRTNFVIEGFEEVHFGGIELKNQSVAGIQESMAAFSKINFLTVDMLNISDNKIISLSKSFSLLILREIRNLTISNLYFHSNTLGQENWLRDTMLGDLSQIQVLQLLNHTIENNNFKDANVVLFSLNNRKGSGLFSEIEVRNINCSKNEQKLDSDKAVGLFSFLSVQGPRMKNVSVDNVNFIRNQLSGKFFSFQVFLENSRTVKAPVDYYFKGLNIAENLESIDTNFIYFTSGLETRILSDCLQLVEPFRIWILGSKISNNSFRKGINPLWNYGVSLFYFKEAQVHIMDSVISMNRFEGYNMIQLEQKASSILFANNCVTDTIFNNSQLIMTNYVMPEFFCNLVGTTLVHPNKVLYRYAFVTKSNFTRLQVTSGALFTMNNGFVSIKMNSFQVIELNKSSLISSSFTPRSEISVDSKLRDSSLGTRSLARSLFDETVDVANQYGAGQLAFFNFENNSLIDLKSDGKKMFLIIGYGSNQGWISFEKNHFYLIAFSSSYSSEMISIDCLETVLFVKNHLQLISGQSRIISSPESKDTRRIMIDSNSVWNLTVERLFVFYSDSLEHLSFSKNVFRQTTFTQGCISINTQEVTDNFVLDGNFFREISLNVTASKDQAESYGFISIYVVNSFKENSELIISNNVFLEPFSSYIGEMAETSRIHYFFIQSCQPVRFKNLTFNNGQLASIGNLIRVVNSPSLSITDSLLSFFYYGGEDGMITTCANEVIVRNNIFWSLTNFKRGGLLTLSPFSKRLAVFVEDNRFQKIRAYDPSKERDDDIYNPLKSVGVIINVKTHKANSFSEDEGVKDDPIAFKMTFKDCQVSNIESGYAIKLTNAFCEECLIKNTSFSASARNISFGMSILDASRGVSGIFCVENITLPSWNAELVPYFRVLESDVALKLRDIISDFDNSFLLQRFFFLALIDSGSFEVKDSVFQYKYLDKESVIQIIPKYTFDSIHSLPVVVVENVTFDHIFGSRQQDAINMDDTLAQAFSYSYEPYKGSPNAIIFCATSALIAVRNCTFEALSQVSAIFITDANYVENSSAVETPSLKIENSRFLANSFSVGGSISVLKQDLSSAVDITIKNSTFEKGIGEIGGSLFILGSKLRLEDSLFVDNYAIVSSGAIFLCEYGKRNFVSVGNEFRKNRAEYNSDIGTVAKKAHLNFISSNENATFSQYFNKLTKTLVIKNISNAELEAGSVTFEFFDNDNERAPDILLNKEAYFEISTETSTLKFDLPVQWMSAYAAHSPLKNIPLNKMAGESLTLTLKYNSQIVVETYSISIALRPCIAGEYNKGGRCEVCEGTTFSLSPETPCASCLANSKCSSRSEICPSVGFWNVNSSSSEILACRNDGIVRCENGFDSCQSCAEGYTGPLCNACDFENSFVEGGYLKCGKCQNPSKSLVYSVLAAFSYLLYQFFSVNLVYAGNRKILANEGDYLVRRKIERSYYMKAMLTYTQLMSILYMESSQIYRNLGLFSQIGSPTSLIKYGAQCTLTALGVHYEDFLYYQITMIVSAPVLQLLLIVVLILLARLILKDTNAYKKLTVAVVYLIISYQPGIVTNLALILSCSTINGLGYKYVSSHPHWQCSTPTYEFFSDFIAIPNLIIWSLVIPLVILGILVLNKHNLRSEKLRIQIGVLFFDLKEKYYFWGIILMMLKVVLSFLAYGLERKSELPIFVSLVLLWLYQTAVRTLRPYNISSFNNFEITLMNLLIFNIIVARYLLVPSNGSIISHIALILALILNGGFLALIGYKILSLTLISSLSFFERKILKRNIARSSQHHPLNDNQEEEEKESNPGL